MEFVIQQAAPEEYGRIAGLLSEVLAAMANKDWFVADNAEYTYGILNEGKGIAFTAVDKENGALAGVFMAAFPGMAENNLGRDGGIPEEELPLCAHMDSAAVLPEYRGHKLQYRLMQTGEERLRAMGFRYLFCTVHPDNRFSMDNILSQGYEHVKTGEKYGGYLRSVMMKRLA